MNRYKKTAAAILGCMGIFLASAGVTNAFLQKPAGRLDNAVTPGGIGTELTEPLWKKEAAKDLVPGQAVSKNPIVTNTGKNDSWVFLRVDVPVRRISLVDPATKRKTEKKDTELLSFQADQDAWELVEKKTDVGAAHYVYGFKKILRKGASTPPLFGEVGFVNYLEGELDPREVLTMPIEAVAIQSNAENADAGLKAVYQAYLAQETADGKEE